MGNSSSIDNNSDQSSIDNNSEQSYDSDIPVFDVFEYCDEDSKDIANEVIDEAIDEVLHTESFSRQVKVNFNNLNEYQLNVKKSSHYLFKRILKDDKIINYDSGTLEYSFLNSLLYTDIHFEVNNNYVKDTDLENIRKEVINAKKTFQKYKWPSIDVTRKSVEETAASIIKMHEIYINNAK